VQKARCVAHVGYAAKLRAGGASAEPASITSPGAWNSCNLPWARLLFGSILKHDTGSKLRDQLDARCEIATRNSAVGRNYVCRNKCCQQFREVASSGIHRRRVVMKCCSFHLDDPSSGFAALQA